MNQYPFDRRTRGRLAVAAVAFSTRARNVISPARSKYSVSEPL